MKLTIAIISGLIIVIFGLSWWITATEKEGERFIELLVDTLLTVLFALALGGLVWSIWTWL